MREKRLANMLVYPVVDRLTLHIAMHIISQVSASVTPLTSPFTRDELPLALREYRNPRPGLVLHLHQDA